jgi:hypothetical protein
VWPGVRSRRSDWEILRVGGCQIGRAFYNIKEKDVMSNQRTTQVFHLYEYILVGANWRCIPLINSEAIRDSGSTKSKFGTNANKRNLLKEYHLKILVKLAVL